MKLSREKNKNLKYVPCQARLFVPSSSTPIRTLSLYNKATLLFPLDFLPLPFNDLECLTDTVVPATAAVAVVATVVVVVVTGE
jgi:hypothetical protein